jgi:hypothetical protein
MDARAAETLGSQRNQNDAISTLPGTPDTPNVRVNLSFNSEEKIKWLSQNPPPTKTKFRATAASNC